MSGLLWPGDHRADPVLDDTAVVDAMVAVEAAWAGALVAHGIAPPEAAVGAEVLRGLVSGPDLAHLAVAAEPAGNPAEPLVRLLRERLGPDLPVARWMHRGLTSQDVVDSVLLICSRAAVDVVRADVAEQVQLLTALVERHRRTSMVARTLTQHAVPTTFALKASQWLAGVLDAYEDLVALRFPAQLGGAAGTMSALVELAAHLPDPLAAAEDVRHETVLALGLELSVPWQTVRSAVTRLADAAVGCTAAWGHVANDVLVLSRTEVGEVSEGSGGGSSTMPHKANPTLSVLIRRAALVAPGMSAVLHLAAAEAVDERTCGGWHAEWETLRALLRLTVVAGSQTTDLLRCLQVHGDRMAQTLEEAGPSVRSEQQVMAELAGRARQDQYLGLTDAFVDATLDRAATLLAERPR